MLLSITVIEDHVNIIYIQGLTIVLPWQKCAKVNHSAFRKLLFAWFDARHTQRFPHAINYGHYLILLNNHAFMLDGITSPFSMHDMTLIDLEVFTKFRYFWPYRDQLVIPLYVLMWLDYSGPWVQDGPYIEHFVDSGHAPLPAHEALVRFMWKSVTGRSSTNVAVHMIQFHTFVT